MPIWRIVSIPAHSEMGVFPNTCLGLCAFAAPHWGFQSMKMNVKDLGKVLAAIVALAYGQTSFGQTDDQVFTVTVPSLLSITAPANALIDTTTDQTDGNKVFTPAGPADHVASRRNCDVMTHIFEDCAWVAVAEFSELASELLNILFRQPFHDVLAAFDDVSARSHQLGMLRV